MSDVLLFFNPTAGTQEFTKETLLAEVEKYLSEKVNLTIYVLDDENTKKLKNKEILAEKNWDLVIIGGGDGTIQNVVSVLLEGEFDYPTAILPLGSANGLATCLGIGSIEDALEAISEGKYLDMDILAVNDEICLHLCDFGFNAGLVKKFDEADTRGMMTYFKGSISEIFENKPYYFRLHLEGEQLDLEARMLLIANGSQFGTGAVINPNGKMDDGRFEVMAINPEGLDEVINFSIQLLKGEPHKAEQCQYWSVKELVVFNPDKAIFQIDGDVKEDSEEVKIGVMKNKLRIIRKEEVKS